MHSGGWKWSGITAVGTTVYAAPYDAPKLLVHDTTPVQEGMRAVVDGTGLTLDVDVSGAACRAEKEALKDDDAAAIEAAKKALKKAKKDTAVEGCKDAIPKFGGCDGPSGAELQRLCPKSCKKCNRGLPFERLGGSRCAGDAEHRPMTHLAADLLWLTSFACNARSVWAAYVSECAE